MMVVMDGWYRRFGKQGDPVSAHGMKSQRSELAQQKHEQNYEKVNCFTRPRFFFFNESCIKLNN